MQSGAALVYNILTSMKYAVISDIHANESALRHVLDDAHAQGVSRIICLGDVIGYGPLPRETVALVRASAAITLAGNHDDAVSGRQGADDFIDLAGEAVSRHRDALDATDLAWLRTLPYTCELEGAIAAHGDFTEPSAFHYIETEADAEANFAATDAQLMFVGHTHVPALFLTGQSGRTYRLTGQDFTLEEGKRYIVNPGSVGYPRERDGVCLSSYVIYDTATRAVFYRQLPFAVSSVMQRGNAPRKRRGPILALLALALIIGASAIAFFLSRHAKPVTRIVTVKEPAADSRALVFAERSLTLAPGTRFVRANLILDREAGSAALHVAFKNATGGACGDPVTVTVKKSARQRLKVPEGAVSAHFTVSRLTTGTTPRIISFAPATLDL